MSLSHGCRGLRRTGVLVLAGLFLVAAEVAGIPAGMDEARAAGWQDPGGQVPGDDAGMPRTGRSRSKSARKKARPPEKGASPKARGDAADAGGLKFSQDIAPILVANCGNCHSKDGTGVRRGKLDLSTFANLEKGRPDRKVIVPGKPEESHLVLRINGGEQPKMPQGNNQALSADAIAKITQWVKEGARLDAGVDPRAAMASYAAKPDQLRRRQLSRMSDKERDEKVIEAGKARWKQSGSKEKPEVVPGTHFIVFSNLPSDRVGSTLRSLETSYNQLKRLLGPAAMEWPEKVSLYVFKGNNEFVEFVRSVEGRDVDPQDPRYSVRFNVPQPYIAAVDPGGGRKEEPSRRRGRGKRAEESSDDAAGERSLLGILTEAVGSGSVGVAGNAPRWLRDGIGTYLAASAEPRGGYYAQLRQAAFRDFGQGWQHKATLALGDQLPPAELRAVGFALVECMIKIDGESFPTFLHAMLEGGQAATDDVLRQVYGGNREEFLDDTSQWIGAHYGGIR